jgi:hypothetical protein
LPRHALTSCPGRRGVGDVAAGMHRQGYDLQLTRYDARGWRATFYSSGMEHSVTSAPGSAFEPVRWTAVQRAAWRRSDADPIPMLLTRHGAAVRAQSQGDR